MGTWLSMADRLSTDERLTQLKTEQIQAVIDMLCLVVYADNRMSALEEVEFESALLKMPWIENKEQVVQSRINTASSAARYANTPEDRKVIANKAAVFLEGSDANETVFGLAASMAFSDLVLHAREAEVLAVLSAALGIDPHRAEEIQAEFA
jgi:tellurite resistance protein